jgi:hypothetical protein
LEEVILKRIQRRENVRTKNKIVNEDVKKTKELEKQMKINSGEQIDEQIQFEA